MVTDPSGDSDGGSTDTKVVVITATDVDEVPSVAGRGRCTAAPDTAHMVPENENLLDEDDLTNSIYASFMYLAVATDDEDTVSLLLNGDDAAAFKLVDRDGTGPGRDRLRAHLQGCSQLREADGREQGQRLQGEGGGQRRRGQQE